MPKTYVIEAARRKAAAEEWSVRFRAATIYHLELMKMNKEQLGTLLMVPATTMRQYIREPMRIRIKVLLPMMEILKFDETEREGFFVRRR